MYVQLWYYDDIHAFMYRILHIQLNDNRMTVMNKYGCMCTFKNMKIITRPPLETFFFALSKLNVQNLSRW